MGTRRAGWTPELLPEVEVPEPKVDVTEHRSATWTGTTGRPRVRLIDADRRLVAVSGVDGVPPTVTCGSSSYDAGPAGRFLERRGNDLVYQLDPRFPDGTRLLARLHDGSTLQVQLRGQDLEVLTRPAGRGVR
jgi:hypothetical protein